MAYDPDVAYILAQTSKYSEAIHLTKAAELIRRDMLNNSRPPFTNAFLDGCLQQSVPPSLVAFVGMLEHGADIKSQLQQGSSKSDIAISQLLQYNCFANYTEETNTHRHSNERETGELREAPGINDDTSKVKIVPELSESFTNVRPAHIVTNPTPPKEVSLTLPSPNSIQSH